MKIKKKCLIASMIFTLLLTSCGNKTIEPQEVPNISKSENAEDVQELMKSTPSGTKKNEESGISAETYDKSNFAGYDGELSYFYNEDGSVLYYKWFINEKDEDKAKEIYSDVCQALSGSYGDGEENNNEASGLYTTSFTNDKQQITAQLQKANDSGYEVSYMVVG